jgi:hypothetical protein
MPLFRGEAVDVVVPMLQLLVPDLLMLAAMLPVVFTDCDCTERLILNRIARVRKDFIHYAFNGDVGRTGQDLN